MAVNTSSYSVKTYHESLRVLETDPIEPGCFDIHPEFQRDFITDYKWSNALICHFIFHKHLNPLTYHKIYDADGSTHYENLDGKQRSSAFIRLLNDEFVFKNIKSFPHPDRSVNAMLSECDKKYFRQWPEKYKSEFLHMKLNIMTYEFTMDEKMRSDFFADVQNSSCTRTGEVLHSYERTNKLMKRIRVVMENCEWKRLQKGTKAKSDRFPYLQVFACMAYHFIKAPESTKDVTNAELIKWIDLDEVVGEDKFGEFSQAAKKTIDMMCELGTISNATAKSVVMAFFFLFLRKTDQSVIDTIHARHKTTEKLSLPIVRGAADQAHRRYMYIVNVYAA
jgi:hypothetical protein